MFLSFTKTHARVDSCGSLTGGGPIGVGSCGDSVAEIAELAEGPVYDVVCTGLEAVSAIPRAL